jgi:thiamine biosynthesis lipoprotein ApbE
MKEEAYWVCHYCKRANFRDFEGLDECEFCKSETKTGFNVTCERLIVCWQRHPKKYFAEILTPNQRTSE